MLDVAYYAALLQQVHEIRFQPASNEERRALHDLMSALGKRFPDRFVVLTSDSESDYTTLSLTDSNPDHEMADNEETLPYLLRDMLADGIHIPRTASGANLDALRRLCDIIKHRYGLYTARVSDLQGTTVTLVDVDDSVNDMNEWWPESGWGGWYRDQ